MGNKKVLIVLFASLLLVLLMGTTMTAAALDTVSQTVYDAEVAASFDCATNNLNEFTFTVVASNNGTADLTGVVVTDTIPAGSVYVDSYADTGAADAVGQVVTWTIGDLAVGQSATLTITVRATVDGEFINSASVTSAEQDANTANNSDSAGTHLNRLIIYKFYDANLNGIYDSEKKLFGWQFQLEYLDGSDWVNYGIVDSGAQLFFCKNTYVRATEIIPSNVIWIPTTDTVQETVLNGCYNSLWFGNVCLGSGGGHTPGFWSNKNGQALIGADDLAALTALNLCNKDGSPFDPADKLTFRTWLLDGDAVNMAYRLSVQLSAMKLNVLNGFVDGSALVYSDELGFISVNDLISQADGLLGANSLVLSDSPDRDLYEAVKNAIDDANNNLNFLNSRPCAYVFDQPS